MNKIVKGIREGITTIWIITRLLLASVVTFWLPAILFSILFSFGFRFFRPDAPKIATEAPKIIFYVGFCIGGIGALYAEKKYNLLVRLSRVKKRNLPVVREHNQPHSK